MTAIYISFVFVATLGLGDIVPEASWLREERAANSLAATSGVLLDLFEAGRAASAPEVRHAAEVLAAVVDDLSTAVATRYPHLDDHAADDPAAVMGAFARDHQHDQVRLGRGG